MNSITVHIDAGRRAEAPCEAYLIRDNNDITISFTFADGSGFDTTASMTAVLVTAQGKLPDITFSAGQITVPRLVAADGGTLYVGVSQGNIKTTEAARIRVVPSVYTMAHDRTAPDPENPPDYDALPVAESVSSADEVIITDINAGKRKRATLQLLSDLFGAESGHSPFIGTNGNWFEWDVEAAEYIDTEIPAQGAQGETGPQGPKGDTGDSGEFTAIYNSTTWAELVAAVAAGKSIKIKYGSRYGWADVIDIAGEYASFLIIAGEDGSTDWCEFSPYGGWGAWSGDSLVYASGRNLESALANNNAKIFTLFGALTNGQTLTCAASASSALSAFSSQTKTYFVHTSGLVWTTIKGDTETPSVSLAAVTRENNADYLLQITLTAATESTMSGTLYKTQLVTDLSAYRTAADQNAIDSAQNTAIAGKADKLTEVMDQTSGAVTQELDPNKTYVFSGDLTSLTLTLNPPVDGIANIYQVFFLNGSTAVNLLYPTTVTFADAAFTPAANSWTELSIQYVYSTTEGGVTTPHYIAYGSNIEEGVQ